MSLVSNVDYINKRIYLSSSTVGATIDTVDVYKEVRALRSSTDSHKNFRPMIIAGGNIQKTPTTFTPKFVQLLYGCRIVPFNTSHSITLVRDTFTDDNFTGAEVFDLSSLSVGVGVNIFVDFDQVEVVTVNTSGSDCPTVEDIVGGLYNSLNIINEGVQKASRIKRHKTNLPTV